MKEFMDVSRAALRMGAREVQLVCLESREQMPASEEEIHEGLQEGIHIQPSLGPKQFIGKNGKLIALEVIRCTSVFDENRRFNPQFEAGSERLIPCDTVILAIGQRAAAWGRWRATPSCPRSPTNAIWSPKPPAPKRVKKRKK